MQTIQIEKGKPIPSFPQRKYPFHAMEMGDSFFVPFGENAERTKNNVRCCALAFGRRNGRKFSIRNDGEGIRVWRVA
jgi:hypothetical protein